MPHQPDLQRTAHDALDQQVSQRVDSSAPRQSTSEFLAKAADLGDALRAQIVARSLAFYAESGWDADRLPTMLRAVFRRTCEVEQLRLVSDVVDRAVVHRRHLRYLLYASYRLGCGRDLSERVSAEHILVYATAVAELVSMRPRPSPRAWRSLERDVKSLISDGSSPVELSLYLKLIVTDAVAYPHDAHVDLDLFGDLTQAFRDLLARRPDASDLELLSAAIDHQRSAGFTALGLVRAYLDLSALEHSAAHRGKPSLMAQYYSAVSRFAALAAPRDTPHFRRLLDQLIAAVGASDAVAAFAGGACLLESEGRGQEMVALESLCRRVARWTARPQLLRNLVRAIDDREISASADVFVQLQRAGAHGALEHLRLAIDVDEATEAYAAFHAFTAGDLGDFAGIAQLEQQVRDYERTSGSALRFEQATGRSLQSPPRERPKFEPSSPLTIDERNYRTQIRLHDKFFGFSALRYAAQRTPTRGAAELARFGNDVGRVAYLNAHDVSGFPGRGFLIYRVRLEHVFVRDDAASAAGRHPYDAYRKAWPTLADELDDLEHAEFLLARGMIVISCRAPDKYALALPGGRTEQMSLAIFNDHFRNPLSREACLAPTALLQQRLGRSFVGYEDYTGFQPHRPDANRTIGDIRALFDSPTFGPRVVPVGGPHRLLAGFPEMRPPLAIEPDEAVWKRYRAQVDAHNLRIQAWERRGHAYHFSNVGWRQSRGLVSASAELAEHGLHLAREDRDRAYRNIVRARRAEQPLWNLVERHLNLLDLLLICFASWHKGHTRGELVSHPGAFDGDEFEFASRGATARQLVADRDGQAAWNQNSIRMLALAHEWHSQLWQGISDRRQFPVLAPSDTFRLGNVIQPRWWLDTFDMIVRIEGQEVPLSTDSISMDDELFWHTQIMPRAADTPGSLRDLRFYPRESLGL